MAIRNHKANSYQYIALSPSNHLGLAIHHPHHRLVNSTPIHLFVLSGISYIERLRAQETVLEQLTRFRAEDSFSFGDAEA